MTDTEIWERAEISLTKGKVAIIDAVDLPVVSQLSWYASIRKYKYKENTYAAAWGGLIGIKRIIWLHRLLLGILDRPEVEADHRDGDGLNNRRSNLRICTRAQNARNGRARAGSGFKGVYFHHKGNRPWRATIHVDNRQIILGDFANPQDAAHAYNVAALSHYGEFANLNIIGES